MADSRDQYTSDILIYVKYTSITCAVCDKIFDRETRFVKSSIKKNPDVKFLCSLECKRKFGSNKISTNCSNCSAKIEKRQKDFRTSKNHFCSKSCAMTYSNRLGITGGSLFKKTLINKQCPQCGKLEIKPNSSRKLCKICISENSKDKRRNHPCVGCGTNIFKSSTTKFCQICRKQDQVRCGLKSAAMQRETRRSKNEIYLADLCKQKFTNVLENIAMFNNWDADIILPDYKIAILWNGIWHYKKVRGRHSLSQVQARDKIKLKQIQLCNYTPYVIKDMGKYDPKFVESEFEKFLEYLEVMNKSDHSKLHGQRPEDCTS